MLKREATEKCDHAGRPTGKKSWMKYTGLALIYFGVGLAVVAQATQALHGLGMIGVSFEAFEGAVKLVALGGMFYAGEVTGLADRIKRFFGMGGGPQRTEELY